MELGIYSFGDMPADGSVSPQRRIADLLEEIELADQVGLDVFSLGEHHRPEYVISSPATILAAAASKSSHIRLSSAVTVLSSDDPVRVFQQFSTLDLISNGRAEIMAGRGSFIESFPLFGYDLQDYDELFIEHLDLLLHLRENEIATWNAGRHRAPIASRGVYPRPIQNPLPVWIAVGGTPQSVVRAAALGLPLAIAILGGDPRRFAPLVNLHREVAVERGFGQLPVSINMHGFIADTAGEAAELYWPGHAEAMGRIGRERGWPPQRREDFDRECGPLGAIALGSPQEVIDKIVHLHNAFKMERFQIQFSVGHLDHTAMMRCIELYGTVVAPAVRAAIAA